MLTSDQQISVVMREPSDQEIWRSPYTLRGEPRAQLRGDRFSSDFGTGGKNGMDARL
jgi:hypothetical protein